MNTKSSLSDVQVLKDSQSYPWMFGILIDRYQQAFLRKGNAILHSSDLAEDVVQDTFIKIYKYANKFSERENASFRSWAYKILVNTCYTYASVRAKRSGQMVIVDFAGLDNLGEPNSLSDKDQLSFIQSVLSRLPDNLSRLLSLYFFEDKSYEEIAEIENISLSAVRSGIHRAKKQFRIVALQMA